LSAPHYVRFARSLALLGGLGAAATGCDATTHSPTPDAAAGPDATIADDAAVATADAPGEDAPAVASDAFDVCTTCGCFGFAPDDAGVDAGVPDCLTLAGAEICCAAVGPLFPPDLAV
jgi:hypothetical protein